MIAAFMMLQAATVDYWTQETEAFESYRTCMLAQAPRLGKAPDDARTLEAAARSTCSAEIAMIEADFALDAALIAIENSERASPVLHDPNEHLERLKQQLSDDFAAAIVEQRLKAR